MKTFVKDAQTTLIRWHRAEQDRRYDIKVLKMLNNLERDNGFLETATMRRQERQQWLADIVNLQESGRVALCWWSRDCDGTEGTDRRVVSACAREIDQRMEHAYFDAEGPVRFWLERPSQEFDRWTRDRALEAFEDGHPHLIRSTY